MKFLFNVLAIALISGVLAVQSSCKKHPETPEPVTDQQLDKLTKGPWKMSAVTRDNVDESSNYPGFTLTLTGTKGQTTFGYSTTARPSTSPWPGSGTFTFDATNPTTTLARNDNPPLAVTYSVTDTNLTMSFQYSGSGFQSRTGVVNGLWVYTFTQ
jgi:hypothetical protein